MNENKTYMPFVWVTIVVAVLAVGGFLYQGTSSEDTISTEEERMMKKDGESAVSAEGDTMAKNEGVMMPARADEVGGEKEGEAMMVYKGKKIAGDKAVVLEFNKADYDVAIASDKLVVLYFYANWCPTCKEETANAFYPAFNELTTGEVIGFRINYKDSDTDNDEKALAVKYGIPYQHTKVFVKNGKQILKAPDSWNKTRYLDEINKAMAQ